MSNLSLISMIRRSLGERRGATAIEYGLIAGLLSVAIAGTVLLVGTDLDTLFTTIRGFLTPAA